MHRFSALTLVGLFVVAGCDSDSTTGVAPATYTLTPVTASLAIGQDSSALLVVDVKRAGTDTTIKGIRLQYTSSDYSVARVDTGLVTAVGIGSATITAKLGDVSVNVPVTIRPHPATTVELTILTGPAGGALRAAAPPLAGTSTDTGTYYALPADPLTTRLKALVLVGTDTAFCNFCIPRTAPAARVMRTVRFRSLDTARATISNAANPTLQLSTDTTGKITVRDTASAGVRFVLEVPADNKVDTVLVYFKLRPIDSLGVRPDSNFFPTANGTGLSKGIYPNADVTQANVKAAAVTNFVVGVDFLSRVTNPPAPATPTVLGTVRFIPSRLFGAATVVRKSVPNLSWESANIDYLDINAAGSVTGKCAQIGGNCLATGAAVLSCTSPLTSGTMPAAFAGAGTYAVPSCNPTRTISPMPGALCTTTSTTDLNSVCSIWVRVSAFDQVVTTKLMRTLYRVNIGR